MFPISTILGAMLTRGTGRHLNRACDTVFVSLNGHVLIYCFPGILLVPNYVFSDEIEHLSRIYMLSLVLTRDSNNHVILVICRVLPSANYTAV